MHGLMSYHRSARARSLRSDRAPARARLLRSDRAEWAFGCYVVTELWLELGRYVATDHAFGRCVTILLELLSDDSRFFRKAFRKEESISKKYLSKKVSTFSSSGILTLTSLQPFSTSTRTFRH